MRGYGEGHLGEEGIMLRIEVILVRWIWVRAS